ncbi:serine/threonine protein kinase [Halorhabdus utahensis DSM 12940]|uniref:Serine/threonine protein kinase n=1 Tax=Halorhabdus utahensis (strain DSM 12940 / JCM 11049 / AX-2) TaxID=519442 RepID=C7NTN2_HALUD|nr:serine/threonine protein kinase [Halorhabdus utahensis]ACV12222.1 serine/threonine protein kinase [Halorhabdus utahensis DSM 12940]
MTEPAEAFARACPDISTATEISTGDIVHYYHAKLTDDTRTLRVFTVGPKSTDEAVDETFERISGQWLNLSTYPNVVTVKTRGDKPRPWIAVELVDGRPLKAVQSDLSLPEIRTVLDDIAEALRNAALYNTTHGALSPETVWIQQTDDGVTALVDEWGLKDACQQAAGRATNTAFTAPELASNNTPDMERADVYSLGAVAYYALTGHLPEVPDKRTEASELTPPSSHNSHPEVTSNVDNVILKALAIDPADRYDSAVDFNSAISRVLPTAAELPTIEDEPESNDGNDKDRDGDQRDDTDEEQSNTSDTTDDEIDTQTRDIKPTRQADMGILGAVVIGVSLNMIPLLILDNLITRAATNVSTSIPIYLAVYGLIPIIGIAALGLVSTARSKTKDDDYRRVVHKKDHDLFQRNELLRRLNDIYVYFWERPLLMLGVTIPVTMIALALAIMSDWAPTSLAGMMADPLQGTFFWLYVPAYINFIPLAIFYERKVSSWNKIIGSLSKNQNNIDRKRISRIQIQIIIIMITYLASLGVIAMLDVKFEMIARLYQQGNSVDGGSSVHSGSARSIGRYMPSSDFRAMLLFHAATLQALLSSFIAGYIRGRNFRSGMKFAVILLTITLIMWQTVIPVLKVELI